MSDVLIFMGSHPFLTFFLFVIVFATVPSALTRIVRGYPSCECCEDDEDDSDD